MFRLLAEATGRWRGLEWTGGAGVRGRAVMGWGAGYEGDVGAGEEGVGELAGDVDWIAGNPERTHPSAHRLR